MRHSDQISGSVWESINELLYELYKGVGDENRLRDFLKALKEVVPYDKADFLFFRKDKGDFRIECYIPLDWREDEWCRYVNHYYQMDDVLPIMTANAPVMFRASDLFSNSERKKTKYYNEFIDPVGIHHSIEGNIIYEEAQEAVRYYGEIGLFRSQDQKSFTFKELQILKALQPHIANVAHRYISQTTGQSIAALEAQANRFLTRREMEVLELVLEGLDSKMISQRLHISLPTVKKHLSHLYEKYNVKNRIQLISRFLHEKM